LNIGGSSNCCGSERNVDQTADRT